MRPPSADPDPPPRASLRHTGLSWTCSACVWGCPRPQGQAALPPSARQGWQVLQSQPPDIPGWRRWVADEAPSPLPLSPQWSGMRFEGELGLSGPS